MPDMNLEPGCDTCEHIADVRGITLTNTHWFTKSAVDELTAGLRATLEARTAALTRTIERAEKAEAKLRQFEALVDGWEHSGLFHEFTKVAVSEVRAVLEGGR